MKHLLVNLLIYPHIIDTVTKQTDAFELICNVPMNYDITKHLTDGHTPWHEYCYELGGLIASTYKVEKYKPIIKPITSHIYPFNRLVNKHNFTCSSCKYNNECSKCILDCCNIYEYFSPYEYDYANNVPTGTEVFPVDLNNDIPTLSITINRSTLVKETVETLKEKLAPINIIAIVPAKIITTTYTFNNNTVTESQTVISYFTNKL